MEEEDVKFVDSSPASIAVDTIETFTISNPIGPGPGPICRRNGAEYTWEFELGLPMKTCADAQAKRNRLLYEYS